MNCKRISFEVSVFGVAVLLALGSSCGSKSGGGAPTWTPAPSTCADVGFKGCPNDTPATADAINACNTYVSDPICGQQATDYLNCANAMGSCTTSGHLDITAVNARCSTQNNAWRLCMTGGGNPPDGGGSDPCGTLGVSSTCETCLSTNCCSAKTACANNFDCQSLLSCYSTCSSGDTTCQQSCNQTYPNGTQALMNLCASTGQPCATACTF